MKNFIKKNIIIVVIAAIFLVISIIALVISGSTNKPGSDTSTSESKEYLGNIKEYSENIPASARSAFVTNITRSTGLNSDQILVRNGTINQNGDVLTMIVDNSTDQVSHQVDIQPSKDGLRYDVLVTCAPYQLQKQYAVACEEVNHGD